MRPRSSGLAVIAALLGHAGCGASTQPREPDAGAEEPDAEALDGGSYLDAAVEEEVLCDPSYEIYCTIDRPICCRYDDSNSAGYCLDWLRPDCDELLFVEGETGCFDTTRSAFLPEVCPPFRPFCCRGMRGAPARSVCQDHALFSSGYWPHWECTKLR